MAQQCFDEVLKLFEDKSLHRICGQYVIVAEKVILAKCLQLNEVDALSYGTVIDVLKSLINCSVPNFMKLFHFFL